MMYAAYIFVFFFEMLISYIFFTSISDKKYTVSATLLIGTLLFEFGAIINIFVISSVLLNNLITICVHALFVLICFRIKPFKGIFYSNILAILSTLLEMSEVYLITSFSGKFLSNYQDEPAILIAEVVSSKILYFFVALFLIRCINKDSLYVKAPISYYIYPITTLISVISFWYICLENQISNRTQLVLSIVSMLLLFSTIFLFFSYKYIVQRENRLTALQREQDKNKTDLIYYEVLESQNNNLRSYAHDAKNHLSAIQNLNNDPKIADYISQLIECLADYSNVCHSGNRILDVIINKYVTECRLKEILFEFDIKNNNLIGLEYYDTVTILTNLLDNAVEASVNSEKRNISIETDYRNNFSIIIITNSCDHTPNFDAHLIPKTTKENKLLHGFGIKSIKKTLKKYNGDIAFEYDSDNKLFSATIMFEAQNI